MDVRDFSADHVGLAQADALSDMTHRVICVDIGARKVFQLPQAVLPNHGWGLTGLCEHDFTGGASGFTSCALAAISFHESGLTSPGLIA